MSKNEIRTKLVAMGYEVVRIGTRYAIVRDRDMNGVVIVRRLDCRKMADDGLFD